jgi:hypothetical protein
VLEIVEVDDESAPRPRRSGPSVAEKAKRLIIVAIARKIARYCTDGLGRTRFKNGEIADVVTNRYGMPTTPQEVGTTLSEVSKATDKWPAARAADWHEILRHFDLMP